MYLFEKTRSTAQKHGRGRRKYKRINTLPHIFPRKLRYITIQDTPTDNLILSVSACRPSSALSDQILLECWLRTAFSRRWSTTSRKRWTNLASGGPAQIPQLGPWDLLTAGQKEG